MSRNARSSLRVDEPGLLLTVQDLGRPGLASLGVPESGALDPGSLRLANRLVGNEEGAAGLEATLGGVTLRTRGSIVLAVTGAPAPLRIDGRPHGPGVAIRVADGTRVEIGRPDVGLRSYVALRGGVLGREVLGSSSTDLLSGLGAPLAAGAELEIGPDPEQPVPAQDPVGSRLLARSPLRLGVVLGPREDWFSDESLTRLTTDDWTVGSRSNRVGVRLEGEPLARRVDRELPSEGTVAGAIQVPATGLPTLFLADHPVTGGYPVIAVVVTRDLALAAQALPGSVVRLHLVSGPDLAAPDARGASEEVR